MDYFGFTAVEFAALSGIHPRTLTDILAGRKPLRLDQAVRAAGVLTCSVESLMVDDGAG